MKIRAGLIVASLVLSVVGVAAAKVEPQGSPVTVTRELRTKTSSDGASAGAWLITVKCGRESFPITFKQYIDLGYYKAVHAAERAGAKVEISANTNYELANGVLTILDVMTQSTTYEGDCPRPK